MLLRISHETRLTYSRPVSETIFEVRMAPQSDEDQTVLGYRLRIAPRGTVTSYRDGFGNRVDLFNLVIPYQELVIHSTSFVRTHRRLNVARLAGVPWPGERPPGLDAIEFLQPSPLTIVDSGVESFIAGLPPRRGSLADVCRMLMDRIRDTLSFERTITDVHTPVGEALRMGRGVCQDFAHLFLATCRSIGLPARYVSGYIHQPGELATHAWCQVWAGEQVGWIDVDPTHGYFPEDDHVVTAIGRDYLDVPPNRGLWKGEADEVISVLVTVDLADRIPPQWQEWGPPLPRSSFSPHERDDAASLRRLDAAALPHQAPAPAGIRNQQGQQQQQ
jgi:transglutaminase-like putative cysteine protease